jgi:hypothetical protein
LISFAFAAQDHLEQKEIMQGTQVLRCGVCHNSHLLTDECACQLSLFRAMRDILGSAENLIPVRRRKANTLRRGFFGSSVER